MLEYALLKDPDDGYIRDNLVKIYAEQNKQQKVVHLLLKKINKEKKTELEKLGSYQDDMNIAGSYFSLRDYKNAEKFLLNALNKYPGNNLAMYYLAHIYKKKNKTKKAATLLNRILKNNPYNNYAGQALQELLN